MHGASFYGNKDCVEFLLQHGANPSARACPSPKSSMAWVDATPLHFAAINGYMNTIQLLLSYKANLYAIDGRGCRPIDIAKLHKRTDVYRVLMQEMSKQRSEESIKKDKKRMTFGRIPPAFVASDDANRRKRSDLLPPRPRTTTPDMDVMVKSRKTWLLSRSKKHFTDAKMSIDDKKKNWIRKRSFSAPWSSHEELAVME